MPSIKLLVFATLVLLVSCDKQELKEELTKDNLVGRWEAKGPPEPYLLFKNFYGSAFELRQNNEFKLYYWGSGQPDPDNANGSWSLTNGQELIFDYGLGNEIGIITQYEGKTMTLEHKTSGDTLLFTRR